MDLVSTSLKTEENDDCPLFSLCSNCFNLNVIIIQNGNLHINCNKCGKNSILTPKKYIKLLKKIKKNEMKRDNYELCYLHKDRANRYYCNDCLVNFCELCENAHCNHSYFSIDDYVKKYVKMNIKEVKIKLIEQIEYLENYSKQMKNNLITKLREEIDEIESNYIKYENNSNKFYQLLNIILNSLSNNNYESIINVYSNLTITDKTLDEISNKEGLLKYFNNYSMFETNTKAPKDLKEFIVEQRMKRVNDLKISEEYNNKGYSFYDTGNYKEALIYYNKAIELNKISDEYFNNKGNCLFQMNKYEEALMSYYKAVKINPNEDIYYNNISNCYYFLKNYKEALINYDKAISLNPNIGKYHSNKKKILMLIKNSN